ncbi:MAG: hypothetical protein HQ478_13245 [Chloroflexi bacterium]|nr:hypothetical protein [Chloroflexota bacterium]
MDGEMIVLRLLHILPGVMWAGGAVFATWIMEPRLRALGPQAAGPAMMSVGKLMGPVLLSMGGVTIIIGLILIDRTPGRSYDQLFNNGWGWAIGIGLIASLIGFAFGMATSSTAKKLGGLMAAAEGPPNPEEIAERTALAAKLRTYARIASVFVVIAVATMASASAV